MLPELACTDTYTLTPAGAAALDAPAADLATLAAILVAQGRAAQAWRDLVAWNLEQQRAQPCGLWADWLTAERALSDVLEAR